MKNELKRTAAVDTAKKAAPAVASVEKTVSAKEEKATVKTAPVNTVEKKTEKTEETAAEKTAEKTEKAVKTTAKAAATKAAAAKAPAKKAPVKKAVVKETVYLQYLGKEINQDDIMKQVKEVWTKELKNKVSDMKSVTLYLKPEENAAYYVINDDVTGKINL